MQRNRRNRKPEPLEPFHLQTVTEPNRTGASLQLSFWRFRAERGQTAMQLAGWHLKLLYDMDVRRTWVYGACESVAAHQKHRHFQLQTAWKRTSQIIACDYQGLHDHLANGLWEASFRRQSKEDGRKRIKRKSIIHCWNMSYKLLMTHRDDL